MHKDTGNVYIEVQGIKCYLPAQPPRHEILNYELKKKDQKWRRTLLPEFTAKDIDIWDGSEYSATDVIPWDEAVRQEHIKITGCDPYDLDKSGNPRPVPGVDVDTEYCSEAVDNFRQQELNRIHNGVWVYVNGKPYYLPGFYYFYLAYWWVGDGYPEFRYPDLELCWLIAHAYYSPVWLGVIYITIRGTGKSYLAGAIDYWVAITKKEARNGIQSKTDDDAKDFFREKIQIPVSKLPEFLRGINKDMFLGDTTNNSVIDLSPPPRKKINARVYAKMCKDALRSFLDYRSSSEKAYDGASLSFYIGDEVGKTEPSVANVKDRWDVVFNCLWRGNKKRGTAILTTTVSKMSEGGAECKKIWDASSLSNINKNGRTASGLIPYFRNDLNATYFDEYGFPDIEKSRQYHDAERESRRGDPQSLVIYKQQNPRTIEEAFWITAAKCIYNGEILLLAKDRNVERKPTRRVDFVWKEKDKEAMWVENNENGRWEVSMLLSDDQANMVQVNEAYGKKTFTPKAGHKRVMAFDPFASSSLAREDQGSNGAAAVFQKFDYNLPEDFCNTFCADYLFRPNDPWDCFDDILIAAFYYGCPILVETNKGDVFNHFKLHGYKWGADRNENDFVMERPESTLTGGQKATDGIYVTAGIIDQYTNATASHIINHGYKLKHNRIIDDWLTFDPTKTKKFDSGVAASLALIAAEARIEVPENTIDLGNIFKTYNNTGAYSKVNSR